MKSFIRYFNRIALIIAIILMVAFAFRYNVQASEVKTEENAENVQEADLVVGAGITEGTSFKKEGFTVNIQYGYDNAIKINSYIPVYINIKSEDKFSGYVYIGIPDSSGGIIYRQSVELKKNEDADVTMYVPVNTKCNHLSFQIADDDDDIIVERDLTLNVYDTSVYCVGVLSDSADSLKYITENTNNAFVSFTTSNFPEDYKALDSLDFIIINNCDTSKMSKNAYAALTSWVQEGGTLVLGTGSNAKKVLGGFDKEFLNATVGEVQSQDITIAYGDDASEKETMKANVAAITIDGAIEISTGDSTVLFQYISRGKGKVLLAGFDLAIKDTYYNIRVQLTSLVYQYCDVSEKNIYNEYLDSILQSTKSEIPSSKTYVVILVVYALLLVVSYAVLHFIRRKELLWIAIPACSIIMCIVMMIAGSSTRMKRAHSTYYSITKIDSSKNAEEKVYFNITSPNNYKYTLKLKDKYDVYSISLNASEADETMAKENDVDFNTYISFNKDETQLMFKDMEPFSTRTYSSVRSYTTDVTYESSISCWNNKYTGTFKNTTGYDLKNACMVTDTAVIYIGDIANGEEIKVDELKSSVYHSKDRLYYSLYNLMESDVNDSTYSKDAAGNITSSGLARALQYYVLSNDFSTRQEGCIFAICENDKNFAHTLKIDTEGIDTLAMKIDINYTKDTKTFVPDIRKDLKFLSGEYYFNTFNSGVYVAGTTEAEYNLGEDTLDSIIYSKDMNLEYMWQSTESNDIPCDVYLWNYSTSEYDKMFTSGTDKTLAEITNYVSKYNSIKVKFVTNSEEQIAAPAISIIKSAK